MMKNPAYKGKWVHPEIDNPDYSADSEIYAFEDFGRVGLDLWQVCRNFTHFCEILFFCLNLIFVCLDFIFFV